MSIEVNGIAHIQMTIHNPARRIPLWEELCHFPGMKNLVRADDIAASTLSFVNGTPSEARLSILGVPAPGKNRRHKRRLRCIRNCPSIRGRCSACSDSQVQPGSGKPTPGSQGEREVPSRFE